MAGVLDVVQSVLTQGLDAAKTVKLAELQVNNPGYNTVGPYGGVARTGQGAYSMGAAINTVPPLVWVGGAALLALLILPRLLRR